MALADREEIELLLCGGQVRHGDAACFGAQAEAFFAEFYADKAFLGSGGVHAQAGLTDYHPPEVITRRTIIAHAAASYVLADSSKLGAIAVHRVCPLSRVTAVLTDPEPAPRPSKPSPPPAAPSCRAPAGGSGGTGIPPRTGGHRGAVPRGDGGLHGSGHDGPVPEDEELETVRLPPAVRPLAAPLRVVRGGVLVHLDHHRDLHHLRVRAGHRRDAGHLDLAHRDRRPGAGGAGLRRALGPGPAVRVLLPVGLAAGQHAAWAGGSAGCRSRS